MNLGLVGQYLGAAEKGNQDFAIYHQNLLQKQQEAAMNELKLKDYQRQLEAQRQQSEDQKAGNALLMQYFQGQQIPPPPAQPPAPGQPSVPMAQPGQPQQPQSPPNDPQGLDISKLAPQQIAMLARKNPQAFSNGARDFGQTSQSAQPTIPPYQSMNGAGSQPAPAAQMPETPKLNMQQIAQWAVNKGVSSPGQFAAFLDRAQSFMTNDAKVEASYWKQAYQSQVLNQNQQKIDQKAPLVDAQVKDIQSKVEDRPRRTDALFMNATSNAKKADAMAGNANGPVDKGAVEAATWNYLLKGTNPPARGGLYQATMKNVAEVAKENGMSVQELTSASADVKTKLSAKRNFEVRTQNLSRAENQLSREIPVMEDAISKLDLPSLPSASRGKIWALREMGDPNVTKLDQAAEAVFNEFQGIITGNPGTLNVQDVLAAKEAYKSAQTPKTMKAAIEGMRRIIQNAKSANDETRNEIMTGINEEFGKKKGMVFSNASELQQAIKSGKIKKGETFNDPDGNPHVVN